MEFEVLHYLRAREGDAVPRRSSWPTSGATTRTSARTSSTPSSTACARSWPAVRHSSKPSRRRLPARDRQGTGGRFQPSRLGPSPALRRVRTEDVSDTPAAGEALYRRAELHRMRGDLADAEGLFRSALLAGREPQPGLALLRVAQGDLAAVRRDHARSRRRRGGSAGGGRARWHRGSDRYRLRPRRVGRRDRRVASREGRPG